MSTSFLSLCMARHRDKKISSVHDGTAIFLSAPAEARELCCSRDLLQRASSDCSKKVLRRKRPILLIFVPAKPFSLFESLFFAPQSLIDLDEQTAGIGKLWQQARGLLGCSCCLLEAPQPVQHP